MLLLALACADPQPADIGSVLALPPMGAGSIAPEFELLDHNTSSVSFEQLVSPTQQRGSVSAWYFGHST